MGNMCLLKRKLNRLLLHHEIVMVRLVTGFFIVCSKGSRLNRITPFYR